jgi:uncharacterized membrane protein
MSASSTTGLDERTAAMLSYLGWWVTGAIFWFLERQSAFVRFHAIQSTIAFGGLALIIGALGALALLLLTFAPSGFSAVLSAAFGVWIASVVLWGLALWKASQGEYWRIPLVSGIAEAVELK